VWYFPVATWAHCCGYVGLLVVELPHQQRKKMPTQPNPIHTPKLSLALSMPPFLLIPHPQHVAESAHAAHAAHATAERTHHVLDGAHAAHLLHHMWWNKVRHLRQVPPLELAALRREARG